MAPKKKADEKPVAEETAAEVELTEEEEAAAIAAAKVTKADADAAAAVEAAAAAERAKRQATPEKFIGIDVGRTGDAAYQDAPKNWDRDRTVFLAGVTYEHVSDDADGVWIYRHLG